MAAEREPQTGVGWLPLTNRSWKPYRPGGDIWETEMARRDGYPYRGGAVCWDRRIVCEGVCRDCLRWDAP